MVMMMIVMVVAMVVIVVVVAALKVGRLCDVIWRAIICIVCIREPVCVLWCVYVCCGVCVYARAHAC